jgi:hypothetical protein
LSVYTVIEIAKVFPMKVADFTREGMSLKEINLLLLLWCHREGALQLRPVNTKQCEVVIGEMEHLCKFTTEYKCTGDVERDVTSLVENGMQVLKALNRLTNAETIASALSALGVPERMLDKLSTKVSRKASNDFFYCFRSKC